MGLVTEIENLIDLKEANAEIASRASELFKDCTEARKIGTNLQRSLTELSRLLTLTRQECLPRDQALCDTLQTSELNVSFRIDQISSDKSLQQLQDLEEIQGFNNTIEQTHRTFQGLPRRVSLETAVSRAGDILSFCIISVLYAKLTPAAILLILLQILKQFYVRGTSCSTEPCAMY
ncbi:hypothetical protein ILUMI_16485 [Ignelater luminosus]|uniref:Uncharacterized protein n=1 Tax=Ignelater luminosus TaxID=2038154 RepID=A0A8K0CLR0_IGNLU|nr:hypothetical protein ILUMI_16485 [Ignelater luminosus]